MHRSTLFVTCVLFALGSACSSTSDAGTDGGTKTDTGSSSDTNVSDTGSSPDSNKTDTGSTTDTGTGGDTGPTDPTCAAKTTNKDCQTCCHDAHTDAYNAFVTALLACACKSGNCDTACGATACASPPKNPDTTCNACLLDIQGKACKSDIQAVCGTPSGACYPFQQCIITSGCNGKP